MCIRFTESPYIIHTSVTVNTAWMALGSVIYDSSTGLYSLGFSPVVATRR